MIAVFQVTLQDAMGMLGFRLSRRCPASVPHFLFKLQKHSGILTKDAASPTFKFTKVITRAKQEIPELVKGSKYYRIVCGEIAVHKLGKQVRKSNLGNIDFAVVNSGISMGNIERLFRACDRVDASTLKDDYFRRICRGEDKDDIIRDLTVREDVKTLQLLYSSEFLDWRTFADDFKRMKGRRRK